MENQKHNIKQTIEKSNKISIIPHMSPDGDAIGSSCALALFLIKIGKQVNIISPDNYPEYLTWIPGVENIVVFKNNKEKSLEILKSSDLIFMLDHNCFSREGGLEEYVRDSITTKIMIDHHPEPKAKVDYMLSRINVTSTCELVYEFICEVHSQQIIDKDIATAIYVGINTDTGGLSYNSSFPQTYRIVASLLEKGIDKPTIHDKIYSTFSIHRMKLLGYCLNNKMQVFPEYSAAVISLSKAEMRKYNFQDGDTEGFVNYPHSIAGIIVSILILEKEGKVKLSFRSKGEVAINKLAEKYFNGGGHKNAAGGCLTESLKEVEKKVIEALPAFAKEYHIYREL